MRNWLIAMASRLRTGTGSTLVAVASCLTGRRITRPGDRHTPETVLDATAAADSGLLRVADGVVMRPERQSVAGCLAR